MQVILSPSQRCWGEQRKFANNGGIPGQLRRRSRPVCCSVVAANAGGGQEWVLAIDVGTGGTKAALISSLGSVAASAFSPHPAPTPSALVGPASAEQPTECWWAATVEAVQKCLADSLANSHVGIVRAVAVTGQMQNVILLPQGDSQFTSPAILYSDGRAVLEATEIAGMAGGASCVASITGSVQGASSILAKLRWLDKHNPKAAQQTLLLGGHDYVVWKLCGVHVTDVTTASTTGLTDLSFQYAEDLMTMVGLGHWIDRLPPISSPDIPCGEVTASAAAELGSISLQGLPVLHCCGDAGACTLGAGAGAPGNLYAYLGTSGWVAGSFQQTPTFSQGNYVTSWPSGVFTLGHPDPSLVFKTGSIMTAGGNLAWAASNIGSPGSASMEEVDGLAGLKGAGSGGVLYLPYLNGERCPFEDVNARACFIGISPSTTRAHMFRAVMEGVALAMRSSRDALIAKHQYNNGLGPLRLVGGGARSPVWPVIMAGVFGQTVEVLADAQEVGVKGAALLAGMWLGWHCTLSPDGCWVQTQCSYHPSPADVQVYDDLYSIYTRAHGDLNQIFHDMSALRASLPSG